jgi:hypothetical protein
VELLTDPGLGQVWLIEAEPEYVDTDRQLLTLKLAVRFPSPGRLATSFEKCAHDHIELVGLDATKALRGSLVALALGG